MKFASIAALLSIATASSAIAANPEWDQATRLYTRGDYKSALTAFRKIADKTPSEPTVHYMLAQCYKNTGNTKQAIIELEWISRSTSDKRVKGPADALLAQLRPGGGSATVSGAGSATSGASSSGGAGAAEGSPYPPSKDFIGDSAAQTVSAAAKKGWTPCRNTDCLNFGKSGWHHHEMAGHPPTDMWMDFTREDGTGYMYTQQHIGNLIKKGTDVGPCPSCNGSGWIRSK